MPLDTHPIVEKPAESGPLNQRDRFRTNPTTLAIDRFMTRFIRIGGIGLIGAVFAIFAFILWQIVPLFQGASVHEEKSLAAPAGDFLVLGTDEWGEMPFLADRNGQLTFISQTGAAQRIGVSLGENKSISSFRYKRRQQALIYGTSDGYFSLTPIDYTAEVSKGKRTITPSIQPGPLYEIASGSIIRDLDWGDAGEEKLAAAIVERPDGRFEVRASLLRQEQTLFGAGETALVERYNLTDKLAAKPWRVLVNATADGVLAVSDRAVDYFVRTSGGMEHAQRILPFEAQAGARIERADFVFGDVSVIFTAGDGANRTYSLFAAKGQDKHLFHPTKVFQALPGRPAYFSPSQRNKAFLMGTDQFASLRYLTNESVRWEKKLPFKIRDAVINAKYNKILFLDDQNKIHFFKLNDPHPEASFKAFFGKIWYEGSPEAKYEWQSTGGSDDFEPKLSLIPLIIGTLKGTLYAMVFAIPIALLAALYTSQFLSSKVRAVAKPTMEIMASLPSVVLGFLSALWLAPLIENRVPSILLMLLFLPLAAVACGEISRRTPPGSRGLFRPGLEFLYFIPVMAAVMALCEVLGPMAERLFFTVQDPQTGARIADFRLWWPKVTGASFEQRNSLAVGFMMGFAVIPIIFTIAEDSFSNVPHSLRAGSLALGASRWQTAMSVVLPTASAGIFSAIMIGFGRAIGETMIVVMATGNTPIMDFNIFSGMRTLSANIAVELPEAPHHGTLYRTLFLGAMALFLATFIVNTLAEILRQRLREKYKTV